MSASKSAPGVWACPMYDVAEWLAFVRAMKEARSGVRPVDVVVGCGLLPLGQRIPLRILGYGDIVSRNVLLLRRVLGERSQFRLRLFCSATKLAGLGDGASAASAFRCSTTLLAALVEVLRATGALGAVASASVDAANPGREVPTSVASLAMAALRSHVGLRHVKDALDGYASCNSNGADPLLYGIEHAGPSMFGDLTGDEPRLHVTIAGNAERIFWAARRVVASIACRRRDCPPPCPAMARIVTGIRRTWYFPLPDEPPLAAIVSGPTSADALLVLAREHTGLRLEAEATERVIRRLGRDPLLAISNSVQDSTEAYRTLGEAGVAVGPRLAQFWDGVMS